ncbi:hypothetical protein AB205_0161550, partial [Aquarana catesbeiana]
YTFCCNIFTCGLQPKRFSTYEYPSLNIRKDSSSVSLTGCTKWVGNGKPILKMKNTLGQKPKPRPKMTVFKKYFYTGDGQKLGTWYRRWSETGGMVQEMVRDCKNGTGDGQRQQTWYRRWSETTDMVQDMVRDCGHNTGDSQRLGTWYRRWPEMVQEMDRDCRHGTGDGQRLQTWYRRWSETADVVQEMARDCRRGTRDGQRLQTWYRRWS